mgnify:CR=1 FL=1
MFNRLLLLLIFAFSFDLAIAVNTSFAFPCPKPTLPLPSPIATKALKRNLLPPETTLATLLIVTKCSVKSFLSICNPVSSLASRTAASIGFSSFSISPSHLLIMNERWHSHYCYGGTSSWLCYLPILPISLLSFESLSIHFNLPREALMGH